MRDKVNDMKHEPGGKDDQFVTAADCETGVTAIDEFWEFLVE